MLVDTNGKEVSFPLTIDDVQYPPNIEALYSDDELAAIGLKRSAPQAPAAVVVSVVSQRQLMQAMAVAKTITWDECLGYLAQGAIPAIFSAFIAKLPADGQDPAKAAFIAADSFDRDNPPVPNLWSAIGTDAQIDTLWAAAAGIS